MSELLTFFLFHRIQVLLYSDYKTQSLGHCVIFCSVFGQKGHRPFQIRRSPYAYVREQIFEARIDWHFSWELIFCGFFSSGKTEGGNVIFSTFTILGNTRDWKTIDLKFYLFILSYCLYSKARLLFLEANIKNVIFYPSDDGNSRSASSGFSRPDVD